MQSYVKDIYKTSAWQDFKDEVEVRGKKPSIFLNISSMLPQIVGDCPPNGYDPGRNGYDQTVGPNAAHWKSHGSDRCQQTNSFCGAFHKHLRIPHNHVSFQLIPG
jgi:hypothetical protein